MIVHKRLKLSNGTRVILVPSADTAAATVLALYEVGSRYEADANSGVSHFIEHMTFKGTKRRPSNLDIFRDMDSVGADYNAFTGKDHTGFYVKLQSDKLPLAVDLLEDMVYHSKFPEVELEAERAVIVEEIRMYEDNPIMHVDELMEMEMYRGSSLGRRISGTEQTLAGIGRDDLIRYHQSYYVPSRTVLAVAGRFEEKAAMKMLEAKYGRKKPSKSGRSYAEFAVAKAGFKDIRVTLQTKETEQIQLAAGFPAYPYGHKRLAALSVLSTILGGNMSSRLSLEVRVKRGLAYFIHSSINPYQDVGGLVIQAGLTKARLEESVGIIIKEITRMKTENVTADELVRAKDYLKGKLLLGLEDSSHLADWFARQELLTGKIETVGEKLKRIFSVSAADIRWVANDIFRRQRLTMALIGPYNDGAPFAKLAQEL